MKKLNLALVKTLMFCVIAGAVVGGCGPRVPKNKPLAVGAKVLVTPMPVSISLAEMVKNSTKKKLLITFYIGAKPIAYADETLIIIKREENGKVNQTELKAEELATRHRVTGCSSSDLPYLENSHEGDMLICDGSFSLQNIVEIEAKRKDGSSKKSTRPIFNYEDEEVVSVSVMLQ